MALKAVGKLRRVLLFDGTFGPPHAGHVACAKAALQGGHELLVHVSTGAFKTNAWNHQTRIRLSKLAFAPIPSVQVVSFEKSENYELTQCARDLIQQRDENANDAGVHIVRLAGADWARSFKFWDPSSLGRFLQGVDGLLIVERTRTDSSCSAIRLDEEIKQALVVQLPHLRQQIEHLEVSVMSVPEAQSVSSSRVSQVLASASTVHDLQPLVRMLPEPIYELFVHDFQSYRMFVPMAKQHVAAIVSERYHT